MIIKRTYSWQERMSIKHSIVPARFIYFSFNGYVVVTYSVSRNLPGTEQQQSRQGLVPCLPGSWHSWRACRDKHQADTWTKRLIDDAREWNWVGRVKTEINGSGPVSLSSDVSADTWRMRKSWPSKALEGNKLQGTRITDGTGPDTGLS